MTQPPSRLDGSANKDRLPRRDWIIIPLLIFATIGAICWSFEAILKTQPSEPASNKSLCVAYLDPWIGVPRPANCTYVEPNREHQSIEYHLNNQGYREDANLTPKKPGVFRIVMIGTSFGFGGGSPKDQTIADLLPRELSQRTGRPVELYNESIPGFPGLPQSLVRRVDDALAANPDLILWQMTRWDIKADDMTEPEDEGAEGQGDAAKTETSSNAGKGLRGMLSVLASYPVRLAYATRALYLRSHTASMLNSLLGHSQSQFIRASLNGPDTIVGFLKADRSELWTQRDALFNAELAGVAAKAKAAHVPLVLAVLPTSVQVAMVSSGEWPAVYDPYKLNNDIRQMAVDHGVILVDVLPNFRDVANPERGFRLTDGHPDAKGNRMIASFLAKEMTAEVVRIEAQSRAAQEQVR